MGATALRLVTPRPARIGCWWPTRRVWSRKICRPRRWGVGRWRSVQMGCPTWIPWGRRGEQRGLGIYGVYTHNIYIFIYRFILFIAYDIDYILFVIFINYYVYYVFYANHMRYRTSVHIQNVDIRIYEQWTHLSFWPRGSQQESHNISLRSFRVMVVNEWIRGASKRYDFATANIRNQVWDGTFPGRFLGALAYWTQPLKLFIPSLRMWDTWASPASTSWRKSLPGRNPPSPGGLEQIFCGLDRGPQRSGGNAPFLLDWFWSFLQLKSPCFATQDLNHNSSWTNYHWWLKSPLFAGRFQRFKVGTCWNMLEPRWPQSWW